MLKGLKPKIDFCLANYPEARNCDKYLFNAVIINYYKECVEVFPDNRIKGNKFMLDLRNIFKIPSYDHITRVRRKIQNPNQKTGYKGKYPPTRPDVLKKRGWMEEEVRKFVGANPEMRNIYE